jgi:hypothetical protein
VKWGLLIWVLTCLAVELLVQKWIRRQLFSLSHRLTPNSGCALKLFGLLMLPGTVLHEVGHTVAALVMGARVTKVSLKPRYTEAGFVELGSVVAKDVGFLRNAIVGIAPTLLGSGLILLVGWLVFDLPRVVAAVEVRAWDEALAYVTSPLGTPWGWAGAYVVVLASVSMLPSPIDAESAVGLVLLPVLLLAVWGILYLTQSALLTAFVKSTNSALSWLGIVLAFTILSSMPVLFILRVLARK